MTPESAPELLNKSAVRKHFFGGRGRREVDRLFKVLPLVQLPGSGMQYIRRGDLVEYLNEHMVGAA